MSDLLNTLKNRLLHMPDFWHEPATWQARLLDKAGHAYGRLVTWRATRPARYQAPVPVICIGNFTLGGSGKTPAVQAMARLLQQQGKSPAILLRGYGGSAKGPLHVDVTQHGARLVGDEAILHAYVAPTWVSADRAAGAKAIIADGRADCIIMDDGAQNPGLHKDFILQVIDGGYGLGNRHVFPAGPLREDFNQALSRAQAVLMIGNDHTHLLPALQSQKNTFTAHVALAEDVAHLQGRPLFAFAGIGRPAKFYQTLRQAGFEICGTHDFADHHVYDARDLKMLQVEAEALNAQLVTTTKDWVRIPAGYQHMVEFVPVELHIHQADTLTQFLLSLWAR